jgi:hypothetical protein
MMPNTRNNSDIAEHLAFPRTREMNLFATGRHENIVDVWSFSERKKLSDFNTILDFGGFRLAIAVSSSTIISTGSWTKGIATYTIANGSMLWARSDLKRIQQVCDLSDDKLPLIGVSIDSGPYHILRADTGEDHSKLAGIEIIYASLFEPLYLLVDNARQVHLSALRIPSIWKKAINSFAILHAAFSPKEVVFSEARGPVSCFDFYGTKMWEFQPQENHHILRLVWDMALHRWLGIDWNFKYGGPKSLIEIDIAGSARPLMNIGNCQQAEFSPDGNYLIISTGKVISTQSAEPAWTFGWSHQEK